jgi:hypothetical protein
MEVLLRTAASILRIGWVGLQKVGCPRTNVKPKHIIVITGSSSRGRHASPLLVRKKRCFNSPGCVGRPFDTVWLLARPACPHRSPSKVGVGNVGQQAMDTRRRPPIIIVCGPRTHSAKNASACIRCDSLRSKLTDEKSGFRNVLLVSAIKHVQRNPPLKMCQKALGYAFDTRGQMCKP